MERIFLSSKTIFASAKSRSLEAFIIACGVKSLLSFSNASGTMTQIKDEHLRQMFTSADVSGAAVPQDFRNWSMFP